AATRTAPQGSGNRPPQTGYGRGPRRPSGSSRAAGRTRRPALRRGQTRRMRFRPYAFAALAGLLPIAVAHAQPGADPTRAAVVADSLRREAGSLAAAGQLDQAIGLVERHANDIPAVWRAMFAGKLELDGDAAAKGYTG